MARKTHDAVYVERYQDRNSGAEKKRYINIGALFTRDDGSMSLKLETIPVKFDGWISLYEPRQKDEQPRQSTPKRSDTDGFEDPDIPF